MVKDKKAYRRLVHIDDNEYVPRLFYPCPKCQHGEIMQDGICPVCGLKPNWEG